MRLTSDLLNHAEQRQNPLGDRELYLLGLGIPMVENLGADDFDALELSHNRLSTLSNFPRRQRLQHLYCSNNLIERIDVRNLVTNVPRLETLILSHNHLAQLHVVRGLSKLKHLHHLSLVGNPVTHRQYYRLYVIHCLPQLQSLDFSKIKDAERQQAARLMASAAGAALEEDLEQNSSQVKTFTPGGDLQVFSEEEKQILRKRLAEAANAAEIQEIEASIRKGIMPSPPSKKQKV